MAARYGFGGKVNNLRDTLDKFGKVKDFLNHDDTEMVVPTNLSRPGPNMATRPSWPKHTNFGQMMMVKKKEDDDDEKGNQESFTPADKAAEDSSKKRPNNNFCLQDQDDVDSIIVPNINLGSNPYPNNNVIKPTNYRGTAMDPPKDDKPSYGVNNTSSNKDNSNKAPPCSVNFGPKQHSDYVSDTDSKDQSPPCNVDVGSKQYSDDVSDGRGQSPPCTIDLGSKQHSDDVFNGGGQGPPYTVNFGLKQHSDDVFKGRSQGPPYTLNLGPKQHLDDVFNGRGQSSSYSVNFGSKQHSDDVFNGRGQSPPYTVNLGPKQHSDNVFNGRGQGPPYTINFGPKQHSDYVSAGIGQIKKQNMEMAGWVTNKPNISNGWQDYYPYEDAPLKPQGRYNYNNRAQRWKEITPNPPPQLRLRYGGAYPNLRPAYRRPVIDSNWAEKKYNGVLLTDN